MKFLLPVAPMPASKARPAPRPKSGKPLKVGLLHNGKPNGDAIIQSVFDALAVRGIAADAVSHSKPQAGEPLTAAMLEELKHCDLVVTALAN